MPESAPLRPCCAVCASSQNLSKCGGCKAVQYCGGDHQKEHWSSHKSDCSKVKKAQRQIEREIQQMRDDEPHENYFETDVGHFWDIHETRPYMRARFAHIEAILKIKSYAAAKAGLENLMDLLRLCRGDNMGVRSLVPAQLLRVGQEQKAYDFVKWYQTEGQRGDYDWGDMSLPFLNIEGADVFEAPSHLKSRWVDLAYIAAILLLKVKIVLDLSALDHSSMVGNMVPQEVLDIIRAQTPSTAIVRENKSLADGVDHKELIAKLESQIKDLIASTNIANKHLLPAIVNPGSNLTARPQMYSHGTPAQMQLSLQYSYDAWKETPGAIQYLKSKLPGPR